MTVAELIKILKGEPPEAAVYVQPAYPNTAGLTAEEQVPNLILGLGEVTYPRDGTPGEVVLDVYTGFEGVIADGWP